MLRVTDLTVARGGLRLLEGVSFSVSTGQALVLHGPNGIGKTSLLRVIAGHAPPVSGTIEAAADLSFLGHQNGIKQTLTALENLEFWQAIFEGPDPETALQSVGLQAHGDRLAGQLSAGQRRRLGLARLLVTGQKIWVLDEPTVSLDRAHVAIFEDLLQSHLQQGGAALLSTHVDLAIDCRTLDLASLKPAAFGQEDFL